jgi:hypothetical protein
VRLRLVVVALMQSIQAVLNLLLITAFTAQVVIAQTSENFLDVSIAIFTHRAAAPVNTANPTIPLDKTAAAEKAVRDSETRLLPMYLRYRLEKTGKFGAVRVLPIADNGAELRVTGEIIESDGFTLALAIQATDSTGKIWLQQHYRGSAITSESLNDDAVAEDEFATLFADIVRDLTAQLAQHTNDLKTIKTSALLRYGYGLVPDAFAPYVKTDQAGVLQLQRQPASTDPILQRILTIREREFLFIDVVDESYQKFYRDVKPVYDLWRQVQQEQVESSATRTTQELNKPSPFARGSYRALQESYNNYRWVKVQELYVDELGEGFTNEVEPTQLDLNDSVYKLSGTLEQQYREWRRILAELFALDTGATH